MHVQSLNGVVEVAVPSGKKIEHLGVKIEMIGQIGKCYSSHNFLLVILLVLTHPP
jgi:hypothetical protein